MNKITIIIPVYNNFTTIQEVFDSLEKQNHKELIEEIIIIDDNSNDNTRNLIEKYQNESSFKTKLIIHTKSNGLAANYNEGIELSKTDYFILMHADIVLIGYNSFSKMLEPLLKNEDVIASYPIILHPYSVWKDYNFWQKCLFSRFVGKRLKMITGKFDCFNKKLLLNRIGLFNETTYRTAGEDSDIKIRINKIGKLKVFSSGIEIIHLHNKDFNFSLKKLIKKEAQLAEAQGAVLRKYGILNTKGFILSFFREILVIGSFIPYLQLFTIIFVIIYSFVYTKLVFLKEISDKKIVLLPLINILLLFVSLFYSFKGFIYGKQTI